MKQMIRTEDGEVGATARRNQVWLVARDRHGDSFPRLTPTQAKALATQLIAAAVEVERSGRRVFEVVPACHAPDGVAVVVED